MDIQQIIGIAIVFACVAFWFYAGKRHLPWNASLRRSRPRRKNRPAPGTAEQSGVMALTTYRPGRKTHGKISKERSNALWDAMRACGMISHYICERIGGIAGLSAYF